MKLTIAFLTGRSEPRLDWVIDGLITQKRADDEIEIIAVDLAGRTVAELAPTAGHALACGISIRAVSPKPTIWQGAHRVTSRDWWAKSNAWNTVLCLATHGYIASLDDRCTLSADWLAIVRSAERARASVIAGAYEKIERGQATQDSRLAHAPRGKINCGGGWLYGCTFCLPLDWALTVNGAEEGCDGMGHEDCIFGLMLANAGYRVDYVPAMKVTQRRDEATAIPNTGGSAPLRRTDKGVSPNDKSHAALARFGKRTRTEFTPDLRALRALVQAGGPWPIPPKDLNPRDWYDGQPIAGFL